MTEIPLIRRALLVALALGIATLALRAQLSSALVVRGDEFSVRGKARRAAVYYRRALWLDERNGVAVDRLAFAAILSHRRSRVSGALVLVSRYLQATPNNQPVLMDRAMAEHILGEYTAAERDYARLGQLALDPRAYTFAGFGALHAGDRAMARVWWKRAVQIDPNFIPAQRALARIR